MIEVLRLRGSVHKSKYVNALPNVVVKRIFHEKPVCELEIAMDATENGKADVKHNDSQTHHGFKHGDLVKTTKYIRDRVPFTPDILIVLGSGLGAIADALENPVYINYKDIPNFPVPTVEGHIGRLVFGSLSDVKIVCMQGRFHFYEGYSLEEGAVPIRAMSLLGVRKLIVTNTAGGLNPNYKPGDVMFIKDHLNLFGFAGKSPLRGPNDLRFGPRFLAMNKTYDKCLMRKAKELSQQMGLSSYVHEGIYAMVGGPAYETIAEVNFLRMAGADAVGMSTVPEVLVGRHCGMVVFGFSLITNISVTSYDDNREPSHKEILETVTKRNEQLTKLVIALVGTIGECEPPERKEES